MHELRLVGVHEDGGHLLLSGEDGVSYRLPIDDALRRASTPADVPTAPRAVPPQEPRAKPAKPPVHLTPRDIQARIRTGATAEQVAAESGLDLAHVERYEGPVRAERDYLAYLAQRVEVATPLPSHDGYRSAFGDDPALLGDMVAYRVQSYGVDPASLEWDSWRRQDGSWHVEASFELPEGSTVDLGEQPPAQWTYNPTRKTVVNGNRWAQVLSELEPLDGPLPARRLSAVADRVFDFEAEKADEAPPADQDGLLDVLRSRRGQRLGADEDGDDALAELLTRGGIPAAHPRADDGTADSGNRDTGTEHGETRDGGSGTDGDPGDADEDAPTGRETAVQGLSLAPRIGDDDVPAGDAGTGDEAARHEDGSPRLHDGVSTDTREISIFAQPSRRLQPPAAGTGRDGGGQAARTTGRDAPRGTGKGSGRDTGRETGKDTGKDASREPGKDGADVAAERRVKPKRSSVPSWDDIVFGRKGD
ncbi:septation protein SepH [Arthrobacter antioxidans]|uniref:septation protein SepH n=1 Tax=Arthrobacter antioxidans TaxID=2895818 RepID=UPI001FFEAB5C|nr:septation protein SepH [Arthrobacter antioxidans]